MRVLLALVACLAFLSSQAQYRSFFNLDNPTTIEGKIKNYKPQDGNRFLTLIRFDVTGGQYDSSVLIKKDGTFHTRFVALFPGTIKIEYNGADITLLIRAGESYSLEIDDKAWITNENKSKALKMSGEMGSVSATLIDFLHNYYKFATFLAWDDKSKTDEEMVAIRLQKLKEELRFLENYVSTKKATHPNFQHWAKNFIIYEAGFEIAFELQSSSRHKTFTHTQLLALLKEFPLDNQAAMLNPQYYRFVSQLSNSLGAFFLINPVYKDLRKEIEKNRIPFLLNNIDSVSKLIDQQLLYFFTYRSNRLSETARNQDRFDAIIKDEFLRNEMLLIKSNTAFKEFDLIKKLKEYNVDADLKARLIKILEEEKNNFVYIDFWGTWCDPCMEEMPLYAEVINQLKGKKIRFLFMSVRTTEADALKVKEKYKIDGRFIALTKSEERILNTLLSFSSYPRRTVLKPGAVVTNYGAEKIVSGRGQLHPDAVKKIESYLTATQ